MKGIWLLAWHAFLVISFCLLVESESQIRQCETLTGTTEQWQGDEGDAILKCDLKKWRTQRIETVNTLKDLRDKLDMLCVSANYGKGAGNGAQIMGTVTSIVGSFMELAGLPSFQSIMGIGDVIYHSGSLVEGMSSITEYFGSAKFLNEIEKILQEDKKSSNFLGNRLEAWQSLDENMHEILGFDITSEKWTQLGRFLHEFVKIRSVTRDFEKTVDYMKNGKYSTYIETQMRVDQLLKLSNYFEKNPQISAEIRMGLIGVNRFSALYKSFKKYTRKEISEKVASIPQKYKAPTANTVAEYTFLRSIDIAVNLLSLLDVARVIKEGKSKYSDSLKNIIDILELELKSMEVL
ncbi:hypothetical protein HNY73_006816 [Argiope bruennichi]|uniref:Uncharacterized protein n=1 Tax=Argiope bruennichi TaxID=94029 RepID=A0A8T0FD22_ARGBR|nr:hypothetical protein HNY73_006816 [Argiope bruennichi]